MMAIEKKKPSKAISLRMNEFEFGGKNKIDRKQISNSKTFYDSQKCDKATKFNCKVVQYVTQSDVPTDIRTASIFDGVI